MRDGAEPTSKPMTVALAVVAVCAAAVSMLPPAYRPWNISPIGALALFAAARLGWKQAIVLAAIALALKDVGVYRQFGSEFQPHPLSWLCFLAYVGFGCFLRRTENPLAVAGTTLGAGAAFFLVTNFVAWLEQALPYGYSFAGLMNCYAAAIPFHQGTLVGDFVFAGALFGAHAVLSRAYFPAERVNPEAVPASVVVEENG